MIMEKKKDLIAYALYQMAINKHAELKKLTTELERHINENYVMEECLDADCFICDAIYGNESDTETFMVELNESSIRK